MTNLSINICDTSASLVLTSASFSDHSTSASYSISASWAPSNNTTVTSSIPTLVYFSSSTSWIVPTNISSVRAIVIGAGGGSAAYSDGIFSGGGAGAYVENVVSVTPATTMSVVVGTSGAGGNNSAGGNGGSSSFAGLIARGGSGATSGTGGAGGIASGGTINLNGWNGTAPSPVFTLAIGGPSPYLNFGAGGTLPGTTSGSIGAVILYY